MTSHDSIKAGSRLFRQCMNQIISSQSQQEKKTERSSSKSPVSSEEEHHEFSSTENDLIRNTSEHMVEAVARIEEISGQGRGNKPDAKPLVSSSSTMSVRTGCKKNVQAGALVSSQHPSSTNGCRELRDRESDERDYLNEPSENVLQTPKNIDHDYSCTSEQYTHLPDLIKCQVMCEDIAAERQNRNTNASSVQEPCDEISSGETNAVGGHDDSSNLSGLLKTNKKLTRKHLKHDAVFETENDFMSKKGGKMSGLRPVSKQTFREVFGESDLKETIKDRNVKRQLRQHHDKKEQFRDGWTNERLMKSKRNVDMSKYFSNSVQQGVIQRIKPNDIRGDNSQEMVNSQSNTKDREHIGNYGKRDKSKGGRDKEKPRGKDKSDGQEQHGSKALRRSSHNVEKSNDKEYGENVPHLMSINVKEPSLKREQTIITSKWNSSDVKTYTNTRNDSRLDHDLIVKECRKEEPRGSKELPDKCDNNEQNQLLENKNDSTTKAFNSGAGNCMSSALVQQAISDLFKSCYTDDEEEELKRPSSSVCEPGHSSQLLRKSSVSSLSQYDSDQEVLLCEDILSVQHREGFPEMDVLESAVTELNDMHLSGSTIHPGGVIEKYEVPDVETGISTAQKLSCSQGSIDFQTSNSCEVKTDRKSDVFSNEQRHVLQGSVDGKDNSECDRENCGDLTEDSSNSTVKSESGMLSNRNRSETHPNSERFINDDDDTSHCFSNSKSPVYNGDDLDCDDFSHRDEFNDRVNVGNSSVKEHEAIERIDEKCETQHKVSEIPRHKQEFSDKMTDQDFIEQSQMSQLGSSMESLNVHNTSSYSFQCSEDDGVCPQGSRMHSQSDSSSTSEFYSTLSSTHNLLQESDGPRDAEMTFASRDGPLQGGNSYSYYNPMSSANLPLTMANCNYSNSARTQTPLFPPRYLNLKVQDLDSEDGQDLIKSFLESSSQHIKDYMGNHPEDWRDLNVQLSLSFPGTSLQYPAWNSHSYYGAPRPSDLPNPFGSPYHPLSHTSSPTDSQHSPPYLSNWYGGHYMDKSRESQTGAYSVGPYPGMSDWFVPHPSYPFPPLHQPWLQHREHHTQSGYPWMYPSDWPEPSCLDEQRHSVASDPYYETMATPTAEDGTEWSTNGIRASEYGYSITDSFRDDEEKVCRQSKRSRDMESRHGISHAEGDDPDPVQISPTILPPSKQSRTLKKQSATKDKSRVNFMAMSNLLDRLRKGNDSSKTWTIAPNVSKQQQTQASFEGRQTFQSPGNSVWESSDAWKISRPTSAEKRSGDKTKQRSYSARSDSEGSSRSISDSNSSKNIRGKSRLWEVLSQQNGESLSAESIVSSPKIKEGTWSEKVKSSTTGGTDLTDAAMRRRSALVMPSSESSVSTVDSPRTRRKSAPWNFSHPKSSSQQTSSFKSLHMKGFSMLTEHTTDTASNVGSHPSIDGNWRASSSTAHDYGSQPSINGNWRASSSTSHENGSQLSINGNWRASSNTSYDNGSQPGIDGNWRAPSSTSQQLIPPTPVAPRMESLAVRRWCAELLFRSRGYRHKFVDSHCHIDFMYRRLELDKQFSWSAFKEKFQDSFPANYEGCVAIFCNPRTFAFNSWDDKILTSVREEEGVWLALGCHPKNATEFKHHHLLGLRKYLAHPKVVALGEIGLDYSGSFSQHADVQKQVFQVQLRLALELNLPLVIHCRDADQDCLAILKEIVPRNHKIHAHCFTRDWTMAQVWLEAFPNLYLGLTPVISYKSATQAMDTARNVPLDRLLLETDAPYFVPGSVPKDGMASSHPGLALCTAETVATLQGVPVDMVLKACRTNTRDMYGI